MTDTLLTKCPHCSTTFRLTQAQLDIAGGAVRCGACYQVFHASEHIVRTAVVEEIRTKPAPRPDPVEEAFTLEDDTGLDPYDSSDLNLDATEEDDLFSEEYRASLDKESGLDEYGYTETDTGKKKKGADESWAEDLLKELGEDDADDDDLIHDDAPSRTGAGKKNQSNISSADSAFSLQDDDDGSYSKPVSRPKKKRGNDDLSDTFKTLGLFGNDDPFSVSDLEEEEAKRGSGATSDDESWAKAMLDELEEDEKPSAKDSGLSILIEEPEKPEDRNPFAARDLARSKREAVERAKADRIKQPKIKKEKPLSLRNDETEDFFRMLEDPSAEASPVAEPEPEIVADAPKKDTAPAKTEPQDDDISPMKLFQDSDDLVNRQVQLSALHFAEDEPPRRTLRAVLMVLGALLLLVALAGQYVYFNLDEVSRNPAFRPWLEQICQHAGCNLPLQSDLNLINGSNLVVRSHPHEPNALVVDAIIKNNAHFEQPFPVVQLTFEDINNNVLARRQFQPADYIQDTGIDIHRMPPGTPIHLTLEIVDPGKSAVNYQLQFLAVNTSN